MRGKITDEDKFWSAVIVFCATVGIFAVIIIHVILTLK
jgi:hypothetical protein